YWAVTTGRRSSGIRLLAIAVSVLLLIDPFLASAVGFQLSVVASGGILVLGPAIASRVPGPTVFSVPVAVTLAAQLAVSPLLLATFGEVSLVSLPANLLAGWAAGAVMMWGMSLGLVAGAIGGSFARAVQQPVRALLWWIDSVAGFFAEVPLPPFTVRSALACCGILLVSVTLPSRGRWLVVGALTAGLIATSADSATTHVVAGGIFYRGDSAHQSVLVLEASADDSVVEDIVAINPDTVDVVVVKGGHRGLSKVVRELGQVAEIGVVLAPNLHTVVGGTRVREPIVFLTRLGPMTVTPVDDTSLRVDLEN
ncbi:MAG: ComEC/Rec2 family competence protein, partial [Acidimicrobiales bacterium]